MMGAVPDEAAPDEVVADVRAMTPIGRLRLRLREPPSYWLTRFLLLRLLGLVYFFAFLSLVNQVIPLVGEGGLLPAAPFLDAADAVGYGFSDAPSLFWIACPDWALQAFAWIGLALAAVVLAGYANAILLAALWVIYFSYLLVMQDWFGYGWETQLTETGFLAIFLVPLLDGRPFPRRRPPKLVITLVRWLVLRIMLGAGLIKLRGDPCWHDLTCLDYHFETQPIPNPLSPALHAMPHWLLAIGVAFNHVCELIAPLFVFGPRRARHIAGLAMLSFQLFLILSGNLSFLNWLTIVAIVACFDDGLLARIFPRWLRARAEAARERAQPSQAQRWTVLVLFVIYCVLSVPALFNLMSSKQRMNYSFNRLHLASAYGAFGSMGKVRHEIVFEGTLDETITPSTRWREYEFPCKPGDPRRRPCIAAPYQYRLDWQIWFAPFGPWEDAPWTAHLAWKLLHNDPGALSLLASNPFPDRPPRWIRALRYRYRFSYDDDAWWERELVGTWFGPWSKDSPELIDVLDYFDWGDVTP
jgi:hypothetical protein